MYATTSDLDFGDLTEITNAFVSKNYNVFVSKSPHKLQSMQSWICLPFSLQSLGNLGPAYSKTVILEHLYQLILPKNNLIEI